MNRRHGDNHLELVHAFHELIATQRKTRGDAGRLIIHARCKRNDLTLNGLSLAVAGHDGCFAGRVGREDLTVNDFTLGREEVNVHGRVQVRGAGRRLQRGDVVGHHELTAVQVEVALRAVSRLVHGHEADRCGVRGGCILHGPPRLTGHRRSHGLVLGARLQGAAGGVGDHPAADLGEVRALNRLAIISRGCECGHRRGDGNSGRSPERAAGEVAAGNGTSSRSVFV